ATKSSLLVAQLLVGEFKVNDYSRPVLYNSSGIISRHIVGGNVEKMNGGKGCRMAVRKRVENRHVRMDEDRFVFGGILLNESYDGFNALFRLRRLSQPR